MGAGQIIEEYGLIRLGKLGNAIARPRGQVGK